MTSRKTCVLKNKELLAAVDGLKEELLKEFMGSALEKCEDCSYDFEDEEAGEIHQRLLTVYNEISGLKRVLDENKDMNGDGAS